MIRRATLIALVCVLVSSFASSPLARGQSPAPTTTVVTPLLPGWNNVAYLGPTAPIAQVLAPLGSTFRTAWEFDAQRQTFRAYNPRLPAVSDLTQLTTRRAFWIDMAQGGSLTYQGQPATGPTVLYPGLNSIAYVGQEGPLAEVLAGLAGRVQGVWRWDAATQRWQGAIPGVPLASEFTTMSPGRAYSIQVTGAGTFELRGPEVLRPAPSAMPATRTCYAFQTRQPDLAELRVAFNRAGFGRLIPDASFAMPALETQADGDGAPTAAYVPPTLLKAIAWTESSWRHAAYEVQRGATGRTLSSTSCAFGIMQILTDMQITERPTARQELIGNDYRYNIAAGTRILADKWNLAPSLLPVVRPRDPKALENWYYALWAYHCYGERCTELGLHDNPDDPALTWPRPVFNSQEQLSSRGRFTRADYPYQELVYGVILNPPRADGTPIWLPLPVTLPPPGSVSHPTPKAFEQMGQTLDPTRAEDP